MQFDVEPLVVRARRMRRRGETRKMLVALREACLCDETCASLWTLYGAMLARAGRTEDARRVLSHALWLRRTAGDKLRVRTTQTLIDLLPTAAEDLVTKRGRSDVSRWPSRSPS
jgi:hypothetical protein